MLSSLSLLRRRGFFAVNSYSSDRQKDARLWADVANDENGQEAMVEDIIKDAVLKMHLVLARLLLKTKLVTTMTAR